MAIETHPLSSRTQSTEPSRAERSEMTPSNVILLAAIGVVIGAAAILNFSPFGSLGRYQMIRGDEFGIVIRIDTVTGNLSRCVPSRRLLECERWTAPEVITTAPAPQANQ